MDRRDGPSRRPSVTQQSATEAQYDLYLALAQAYDEQPNVTRKSTADKRVCKLRQLQRTDTTGL